MESNLELEIDLNPDSESESKSVPSYFYLSYISPYLDSLTSIPCRQTHHHQSPNSKRNQYRQVLVQKLFWIQDWDVLIALTQLLLVFFLLFLLLLRFSIIPKSSNTIPSSHQFQLPPPTTPPRYHHLTPYVTSTMAETKNGGIFGSGDHCKDK